MTPLASTQQSHTHPTRPLARLCGLVLLALSFAMPAPAFALDDDVATPPGGEITWARRREIRVIQKRSFLKEKRHAFSIEGGVIPNDDFFTYVPVGGAYNYFFSEDLALELSGAYAINQMTSLKGALTKPRPFGPGLEVRLPETLQWQGGASVLWSLVHGKLAFFSTALGEFDVALAFGVGAIGTKVTSKAGETAMRTVPEGHAGLGISFYMSQALALRLDYRHFFYAADGGGVSYPAQFTLGLTYFTAALN